MKTYFVLDDFGSLGREWRGLPERYLRSELIADLASGQFEKPAMILFIDTGAGICRDVTQQIKAEASALREAA